MSSKDLTLLKTLTAIIVILFGSLFLLSGCTDDENGPVGGGNSSAWTVEEPLFEGNHFHSVFFADAETGWLAGREGIIVTTNDGGTTWSPLLSGTVSDLWDMEFFDLDTGWAVGDDGILLRTNDGGQTWTKDLLQITDNNMRGVDFVSAQKGFAVGDETTILYSLDGGRTWDSTSVSGSTSLNDIAIFDTTGLAVGDDGTILAGTDYNTIINRLIADTVSTDTDFIFDSSNVIDTTIIPPETTLVIDTSFVITYQLDTVMLTIDTVWSQWTTRTSGTTNNLHSVTLVNASTGWAVGDQGTILHTTDGGVTWTPDSSGVITDLWRVRFTSATDGWITGSAGTLLKTTDAGTNWTKINSGTNLDLYDISFVSTNDIWTAGSLALLHSTDGANNWQFVPTGTALNPTYMDITFINNDLGFIVGFGGAVLRTEDGGDSWEYRRRGTQFNSDEWFTSAMFIDANQGWCAGGVDIGVPDGKVIHTVDGGDTWTESTISNSGMIDDIFFVDSATGWAVGGLAIYKSTDSGTNWAEQVIPNINNLHAVTFVDSATGWVVGANGTILKTEDGDNWFNVATMDTIISIDTTYDEVVTDSIISIDTTFDQIDTAPPITLYDVTFINASVGWAVGVGGTVLKTTDGGENWTDQTTATNEDLASVFFLDANIGWAVGFDGIILHTEDGGTNWTIQPPPNTNSYNSIFALDSDNAWIVGENGLILSTTTGGK